MVNKRLFVFGCSMTSHSYASWADLISSNFDEYYNYAKSGGSNIFIANRLIEANRKFNFNPETDTVMIMLSGIGRFSYFTDESGWQTHGDLYPYLKNTNNPIIERFVKDMWSDNWAVHLTWCSVLSMKNLLELKNIPHKFFIGVNNDEYLTKGNFVNDESVAKATEIMNMGINKEPFDKWFKKPVNKPKDVDNITVIYKVNNHPDGHPSQRMHYEFVKKFLPEYDNEMTKKRFEYVESIFDGSTQHLQGYTFEQLFNLKYNKAKEQQNYLFGG